jgi:hypothetical protein
MTESIRSYINGSVNKRSIKFTNNPIIINNYMTAIKYLSNDNLFLTINGYNDNYGIITNREDLIMIYKSNDNDRNNLLKQMCWTTIDNEITMKFKRDINYTKYAFNKLNICPVCNSDVYIYHSHTLSTVYSVQMHDHCKNNTDIDELCGLLDIIL